MAMRPAAGGNFGEVIVAGETCVDLSIELDAHPNERIGFAVAEQITLICNVEARHSRTSTASTQRRR
jgi:hypothetical protein